MGGSKFFTALAALVITVVAAAGPAGAIDGIDVSRWQHPNGAAIDWTAVRVARRPILVAAHSKFGEAGFCRFAQVADFEAIVTGTELPVADARRYEALGPVVIRA